MSLIAKLYNQNAGYMKGQTGKTDEKGNRVFMIFLLKGEERNPLYREGDEFQLFRGKSPKEAAKKVVTEVCRRLKLEDPKYFHKVCRPITEKEVEEREQELIKLGTNIVNINLSKYPGFQFELVDIMNKTNDGQKRTYKYYGERIKLEKPKTYKGKKFNYEAQVLPLRKDFDLKQAAYDHLLKSEEAKKRYNKTQNFEKRHSRSRTRTRSKSKKRSRSKSKKKSSSIDIQNMTDTQLKKQCKKWKVIDINKILKEHNLSLEGTKSDKCDRLIVYKNS